VITGKLGTVVQRFYHLLLLSLVELEAVGVLTIRLGFLAEVAHGSSDVRECPSTTKAQISVCLLPSLVFGERHGMSYT